MEEVQSHIIIVTNVITPLEVDESLLRRKAKWHGVPAPLPEMCVRLIKFLNSLNMDFPILEEELQILSGLFLDLNELKQNRF